MSLLPTAALEQTSNLIHHLTTTPLHSFFPYARFPILHAVRVAVVWSALTRGKKGRGYLQDLFGYLVMAWGGSTITSLLLSSPPSWFLPTPWIIYPLVHFLSRLPPIQLVLSFIPTILLDIVGAYVDGFTRGNTVSLVPVIKGGGGVWGRAILSGICISGGGFMVQLLNLHGEWALTTPAVLRDGAGILDWMNIWSATLLSIVHSVLTSPEIVLSPTIDHWIRSGTSHQYSTFEKKDGSEARAVVILLMGSLLAARVFTRMFIRARSSIPPAGKLQGVAIDGIEEIEEKSQAGTPVQTPTKRRKRGTTPKKSPGPGRG